MTTIYMIHYWNGESWDDSWAGLLNNRAYSTRQLAEDEVKRLQIEHGYRVKKDIEDGYIPPPHQNEKWEVISVPLI